MTKNMHDMNNVNLADKFSFTGFFIIIIISLWLVYHALYHFLISPGKESSEKAGLYSIPVSN